MKTSEGAAARVDGIRQSPMGESARPAANSLFDRLALWHGRPRETVAAMNLLVLISGVADPKWPLPRPTDAAGLAAHVDKYALPSPFDEAALEIALQLRDADPAVTITAVVAGTERLARKVAEWRLDGVHRLGAPGIQALDASMYAKALAAAVQPLVGPARLVLTGREFGDWDDGSVPALLARNLGLRHVPLALGAQKAGDDLAVTRQRGATFERVRLAGPAVVSVTNDARNRLRHPLLKNVMAARKAAIATLDAGPSVATLQATAFAEASPPVRSAACRMLTGSLEEQARALAQALLEEKVAA
jgi:electron transfer flavoprotein beta subunit